MGHAKQVCRNSWEWSLKHFHCTLTFWSKKKRKKVVNSDGFLTKEDKLINYHEWHALVYGIGFTLATFLISPLFMALNLWIFYVISTSEIDESVNSRLIYEAGSETPYFLGGIVGTVIITHFVLGVPFDNGMEQVLVEIVSNLI